MKKAIEELTNKTVNDIKSKLNKSLDNTTSTLDDIRSNTLDKFYDNMTELKKIVDEYFSDYCDKLEGTIAEEIAEISNSLTYDAITYHACIDTEFEIDYIRDAINNVNHITKENNLN